MLNREQLRNYRQLRGLTTRDVAAYCDISQSLIVMIENGAKNITEDNHREFCRGINDAYTAKKQGRLKKEGTKNNAKRKSETKK